MQYWSENAVRKILFSSLEKKHGPKVLSVRSVQLILEMSAQKCTASADFACIHSVHGKSGTLDEEGKALECMYLFYRTGEECDLIIEARMDSKDRQKPQGGMAWSKNT